MSLLIDALKQAEAARAQSQSAATPEAQDEIQLEPLGETKPLPAAQNNARTANQSAPARESRRPRPMPASGVVASDAARELFEIKRQSPNRTPMILAGIGILVLLGGAGYVWYATQPRSSLMSAGLNSNAAPGVSGQLPVMSASTQSSTPATTTTDTLVSTPASGLTASAAIPPLPVDTFPPRRERRNTPRAIPSDIPVPAPVLVDARPQVRSGTSTDYSAIQNAYTALTEGNYALARQRYQDVLRQDPRNIDAMNALGLIAWRSGQPDAAERMFRAAVHADPKDATATSQLAMLYAEGDPTAAESRLRNLIATQPNTGAPYYALGSLLARQERWSEAQQSLFQAYTLDSDNPDVLFNLAVCLEHLSQPIVAKQFYERALQSATRRPAGFDKSVAQGRAQALAPR